MFVSCGKKSNFIRFSPLLMILQHIMTSALQLRSIKFCLNLLFQQSLILLSVFSLFFSQDLPNNMIHQVPIKSLPQEWLWCETWCDDTTKRSAKTIDLVTTFCLCVDCRDWIRARKIN